MSKTIYSKLTAKRPWMFQSRRRLFLTLFVIIVIPATILTVLTTHFVYSLTREQVIEQNTLISRLVAKQIDEEFFGLRRYVESFATRRRIIEAIEGAETNIVLQQLQEMDAQNRKISRVVITDPNGLLLFDYPHDAFVTGQNFSHRDWFKGAVLSRKPYVSEVYQRTALDQASVVMIAGKISSSGGELLGFLGGQYAVEDLVHWIAEIQPSRFARIALFDQHGNQVLKLNAATHKNISQHPAIRRLMGAPAGSLIVEDLDGFGRSLLSHVPVEDLGWTVMAYQDDAVVFGPVYRLVRNILVFFLISLLALGLLGWGWYRVLFAYEEDLRRSNRELETVCYSIAHDLRAPLRAMRGFTGLLTQDYADKLDEGGKDYAARVDAAAERMDKLIRDLLEYGTAAHRGLKLEPVNLSQTFKAVVGTLRKEIQERGARIQIQEPLGMVSGDQKLIMHALQQLLSNAVRFAEPGRPPEIDIWSEARGGYVRFWIRDKGIGIQQDQFEKIFGIFRRLHTGASYEGTGIGLAIVKKAAERLGGKVGVESEPGKGSSFWMELPKE